MGLCVCARLIEFYLSPAPAIHRSLITHIFSYSLWKSFIVEDPGVARRDDRMFVVKVMNNLSSRLAAPGSPRMEIITIACVYIFTCVFVLGSATPVKTEISEVRRVC